MERVDGAAVATGLRPRQPTRHIRRSCGRSRGRSSRSCAKRRKRSRPTAAVDLAGVLERAYDAACDAVEKTPQMLPVLRDAGVVDAGGKGFTLLLAALLEVVDGRPIPEPSVVITTPAAVTAHLAGDGVSNLRYEVMYLLDADDETMPAFRDAWCAIGDSIVVVGGDGLWNCHIHTNDIGAAVEAGIDAGRPRNIRVTDLFEAGRGGAVGARSRGRRRPDGDSRRPAVTTAVVAVGVGEGIRRLLTSLGVQHVIAGGQSMNPSTAQILEAVEACAADAVIVLPEQQEHRAGCAAGRRAHRQARRGRFRRTSVPEALAALVEYDPNAACDREPAGAWRTRSSACEPARSPRPCATHRSTACRCKRATGSRSSRDGLIGATSSAGRRRVQAARNSSSTTTARSSRCSSAPTRPRTRPSASASTSSSRSRTSRWSSTTAASRSTRISSAWSETTAEPTGREAQRGVEPQA